MTMTSSTADNASTKSIGFKARLANALRSKPSRTRLRKKAPPAEYTVQIAKQDVPPLPPLAPLQAHREKYKNTHMDTQLGERIDDTTILHSLAQRDSNESIRKALYLEGRKPGEQMIASLSGDLWGMIQSYLNPCDAANLAFSTRTLRFLLGPEPWDALNRPENFQYRIDFLTPMDEALPNHLFCFTCAKYHVRIQKGQERLKLPHVPNLVVECPNPPMRTRLTPGRNLPFTFVQLALRAKRYSPEYGVTVESLARRWKEHEWTHVTRFCIHKGHLLMRVTSQAFAAPGLPLSMQRLLLHCRNDYSPYFSVCAHWQDGELMTICKCALNHIPTPRYEEGLVGIGVKLQDRIHNRKYDHNVTMASLCEVCRPMRRCPECPTEYLIEIKLAEDDTDHSFKKAISVTRWSDLGDGTIFPEWGACNGEPIEYDSLNSVGRRAICGIFESQYTEDHIPGQRILSLNPNNEKLGEKGHRWY